ncbi:hypothetical protein BCR39DRAFT_544995 [Naematelia encephala]|uniref:Found in mitochondrial proteome protein 51 n=1 Tax=Naematelia encephala TaxID=71784 RepID=A0A1Y2ARJ1_9TREE|nr:hypothetical protein BCR39DRAFT_544995 [Naematelia encephala]
MAGVVLGTGSGVLAAAAVYYTLSTSLRESTASLRGELANSNALLHSSFNSIPPPAASSLIGPSSSLGEPRFGDIVRQKWNTTLSSAFTSIRSTNYTAIGLAAWDSSKELVNQLSSSPSSSSPTTTSTSSSKSQSGSGSEGNGVVELLHDGVEKVKDSVKEEVEKGLQRASDGLHKVSEQVKHGMDQVRDGAELLEKRVEAAKDGGVALGTTTDSGPSIIAKPGQAESGLRGTESFTGGSAIVVKTQRELERNRGRLV